MSIKPAEPPVQEELDEEPEGEDIEGEPIPEPVVAAPAEDTSNERPYQILYKMDDGTWKEDRVIVAVSKDKALDSIAEDDVHDGADYRAVPLRSWDPCSPPP